MGNRCTTHIAGPLILSSLLFGSPVRCNQPQHGDQGLQLEKQTKLSNSTTQSQELNEATRLQQQAERLLTERQYDAATPLAERALALREKIPAKDLEIAASLSTLGSLYFFKGDYGRAEQFFRRALSIRETVADNDLLIAESLNNLAALYQRKGDFINPEPLYKRALTIREKKLGPESSDLVPTLNNLATLYKNRGDLVQAEPLFRRALSIREKKLPADDSRLAVSLNNLGQVYLEKREYHNAEPLFKRALSIAEKAGADTSTLLNNLATLYYNKGDFAQAEPLFQRTLTVREKLLGFDHPDLVLLLINLADVYRMNHKYAQAERLWPRVLEISNKKLADKHPDVGVSLHHLALLHQATGKFSEAVRVRNRGNEIREYNLALILDVGSEAQKLAYMRTLADETDVTVSLHFRNALNDLDAARLSLTTILQRKGRVLDVMSRSIETLRRRATPEDRATLEALFATRSQLAKLTFSGPGKMPVAQYQMDVARLETEVQRLESEVSGRSAEFRAQSLPVTLERVQQAIPADAVLVEFVAYRPFNVMGRTNEESFGAPNYAAYVVRRSGSPLGVSLGETAGIDAAIARLRNALRDPARLDVKGLARTLDERVMRPIRPLLGDARRVFLSPDGELSLIPFAALVDETNEYLVTKYTFTYLTSGRDLLRLQVQVPSREPPVVIANPLFSTWSSPVGENIASLQPTAMSDRSFDFTKVVFRALPGTASEASALGKILSGAKILTGLQATEAAVKQVSGPSVLHLATHGFFFLDRSASDAPSGSNRESGSAAGSTAKQAPSSETALLRSGLVFTGVRQRRSGAGEDGVLTALEATGLDLWGTKLVVLSACDTGVGEVRSGEGVYGLRRALVLAGAESQLMSLWPVSDKVTRNLIIEYYESLRAGEGRAEALRRVQLKMLKSARLNRPARNRSPALARKSSIRRITENYGHPFYWASFIQSGKWENLKSTRLR